MSVKLVMFDCDGVLFDSRRSNRAYYDHLGEKFGRRPLNDDELNYVMSHTVFESVDELFSGRPETVEAIHAYRPEVNYLPFLELLDAEPGLFQCLDVLKKKYTLAVLTNRSDTLKALIKAHGLERWFDHFVGCMDVKKPKPDPEGALKIMAAVGCSAHETVYIGDSMSDALTAQAVDMPFVAYKSPALPADVHIDHFNLLPDVVTGFDRGDSPR